MLQKIKTDNTKKIMSFGLQPRCFDFIENRDNDLELFDFTLSQSENSGLLQLESPIPAKSLSPDYNWIKNKEPNDHAYLIAEQVIKYTENSDATVLFLSMFDKKVYDLVNKSLRIGFFDAKSSQDWIGWFSPYLTGVSPSRASIVRRGQTTSTTAPVRSEFFPNRP